MNHEGCPAPKVLLAFTRGDLAEIELDALAGHVESCRSCAEALARFEGQSDTIVLGEKRSDAGDFYMDIYEDGGNDFTGVAEQSRHDSSGPGTETGGSNFTMTDGSARYIKFPKSVTPLNMWCVSDADRLANAFNY